jgi:cell fate regulator YaaT (PSP1 superfamily)
MQTVARIRMPEKGVFQCRVATSLALIPRDLCLVELDYGLDTGVLTELFGMNENSSADERIPSFRLLRKVSAEDEARLNENSRLSEKAKQAFQLSVSREKGHVKVLHSRFSYGRDRLFIRYSAQMPVDLRRFLGQLQRDFKTHVDLWQVGVRDEAALMGCLGSCGRAVCCCSWQNQFQPVNVRMAKAQEMSLNPVTINGSCGRLKCCLRFEYEQYRVAGQGLPENGSVVRCDETDDCAEGFVVARDVMRGRITVRTKDGRFLNVQGGSVTVLRGVRNGDNDKEDNREDSAGEWTES